ncbi:MULTISPECIES: hypothetical protein [unclassified Chryseobacterium]|uniref:hypothetical protein n=1 Tax=unclassified Chryseobacterium TaxID=2593645 RepID=UPI000F4FA94C|nr:MULTISPECIES: hypothetical protein [unclassified Chryseobacterium]
MNTSFNIPMRLSIDPDTLFNYLYRFRTGSEMCFIIPEWSFTSSYRCKTCREIYMTYHEIFKTSTDASKTSTDSLNNVSKPLFNVFERVQNVSETIQNVSR